MTPTPNVTYVPTRPGSLAKARTVVWVGDVPGRAWIRRDFGQDIVGWAHDPAKPGFPDGHDDWLVLGRRKAWIRKHAAAPSDGPPPLTDAEMAWCRAHPERVREMMGSKP